MQKGTYIRLQECGNENRYIEMFFPFLEPEDFGYKQRLTPDDVLEFVKISHEKSRNRALKHGDDALGSFDDIKKQNMEEYKCNVRNNDYLLIIRKIDCPKAYFI